MKVSQDNLNTRGFFITEICCTSMFWPETPLQEGKKTLNPPHFIHKPPKLNRFYKQWAGRAEISGLPWKIWRCPEIKQTFLEAMTWIFSAPFPAWRGRMMDEPAAASGQIGQFWQMLDARRFFIFALEREPCSSGAPKFSVESGNSVISRFLERSSEHPAILVFQIFVMCRKRNAGGMAGQKSGIYKNGYWGWWDGNSSVSWFFFQEMEPFITFLNLFLQPVHSWHLTAWWWHSLHNY